MTEKRDDVITVHVSAPAGKRAQITFNDGSEGTFWTVPGGTSQTWYVSKDASVTVTEGEPHATVASSVKPE